MITLLDVVGLKAFDFVRTIPKTAYAFLMVVLLVSIAQPAQAAGEAPAADTPLSFIGCPTLAWAAPLQGTAQNVSGMFFGFAIIAVLAIMFLSGVGLVFAGKRQDKAAGAIEGVKNASMGTALLLIGIPVVAAVIWGLATAFNPACTA